MQTMFENLVAAIKSELARQANEEAGAEYADEGAREWIMTLDGHFDVEKVARAFLKALREPTGEMIEAASGHGIAFPHQAASAFAAMIDAALQEKAQHVAPDDSANTTP